MPLQIQPEESLVSYVKRNLFLNWSSPQAGIFEELATRYIFKTSDVQRIAAEMGWSGCNGFNRLLHGHTMMAATHVFKGGWDISYSGKQYASDGERFSERDASYCPGCAKEDIKALGFSYWRRYGAPYVTVCHKHNFVLLDRCPFCASPFIRLGHELDVMWRKCRGQHLADARPLVNEDPLALRRAKVYHRLCTSRHHISDELAVRVLRDKAVSIIALQEGDAAIQMQSLAETLSGVAESLERARLESSAAAGSVTVQIVDALVAVYESYDDFDSDLRLRAGDARTTESLWSTYQAGGMESAHFVEEDYVNGVGYWSCPMPSLLSLNERSHDGYDRRRPKIYPCCNFPHPKSMGHSLKPAAVAPLPGVPLATTGRTSVGADVD